jgi:hypothetical protein
MAVKRPACTGTSGQPFNINQLDEHIGNDALTQLVKLGLVKSRPQECIGSKANEIIKPFGQSARMDSTRIAISRGTQ